MASKLICTGRSVLFAGAAAPHPATMIINTETGKITEIIPSYRARARDADTLWIDAGDKVVLPGLVECVLPSATKIA